MSGNRGESLRVALLNSTDYGGGAESVARLLRNGLRHRGHGAVLWVGRVAARGPGNKTTDDPSPDRKGAGERAAHTRELPCTSSQRRVALRHASKGFFNLGLPSSFSFCDSVALSDATVVHLHNLHGHYFCVTAVPRLAARMPLVWTFHDFFPITGGCAFPYNCERWMSRCGQCPQLGRYPLVTGFDHTRRMQSIKRRTFRDLPATIVTPSEHLARAVRRSGVFAAAEVQTIPYGVDTQAFRPGREEARRQLGLPRDRPVILLAAQGLDDPRKGVKHAVTALKQIDVAGLIVLLVGGGDVKPVLHAQATKGRSDEGQQSPIRNPQSAIARALSAHDVRPLGYVTDRAELASCYAAADLFIFASLAENFPCVVMEAMACGTAVLAFNINGVNEQITPDRTGFMVPVGDTDSLSRAARQLLGNLPRLAAVGTAARRHAETCWDLKHFIDRHERLYREVAARADRGDIRRRDGAPSLSTGGPWL